MALASFKEWQTGEIHRQSAAKLNAILLEADRQGISVQKLWSFHFLPLLKEVTTDDANWLLSEVEDQLNPDEVEKNIARLVGFGAKPNVTYPRDEIVNRLGGRVAGLRAIADMVKAGRAKLEVRPNGKAMFSIIGDNPISTPMPPEMQQTQVAQRVQNDPVMDKKIGEITKGVIDPLRQQFERMMKQFLDSAKHNNFSNNPKYAAIAHQLIQKLYDKVMPAANSALSPMWRKADQGEKTGYSDQYAQARAQHNADFRRPQ